MEAVRYITIEAEDTKDPALFNRLMSIPDLMEVLEEENSSRYVATVDKSAVEGREKARKLIELIESLKGVRKAQITK
jgi:hypothetical protein